MSVVLCVLAVTTAEGANYEGEFQDGVAHGHGQKQDKTTKYVGHFLHGVPHGKGVCELI